MNTFTNHYFNLLRNHHILKDFEPAYIISNQIFEKIPQFAYWSGSGKETHHHYGIRGLAQHTYEVINLMLSSKETLNLTDVKSDHIYLAGLFHDIGKVWDYEGYCPYDGIPQMYIKTKHSRNIHHISRSAFVWRDAVKETGLYKDVEDDITHAILSHHGQREWGSPIMPNTQLAWLLHLCDSISARMNDWNKCDLSAK